MASRRHLVAVNRTVRAGRLDESGLDAAIIELARDLARRMDRFEVDEVPLNLARAYLSALKDLQRASGGFSATRRRREGDETKPEVAVPEPADSNPEESALEKLRREKADQEALRKDRAEDIYEAAPGVDSGD